MTRGDVVLVDWPFSDRTGSKLRPAVVVQADFLNALISDTVLVSITSVRRSAVTEVLLDPAVERSSGLSYPSIVSCNNYQTTDQRLIVRRLGTLSAAAMQQIEARMKTALGLP
jgi:mRNA interferase MazF